MSAAFACPPDCGHCCTHLERDAIPGDAEFRDILREQGVYHCGDAARRGLSLSDAEATAMREAAEARGVRLPLHPRTFLLETRRRIAVVLDWHMPRKVCPLYSDFRCTAYDARPLVCRAYPVLVASPMTLAPECPKTPIPRGALAVELKARRAIDRAHALLDAQAWPLLETPGARFAKGLDAREAQARAARYRTMSAEAFASTALARS